MVPLLRPAVGDIARGGVLEDDFTLAEFDPAGSSVGQENNFHRHLIGKAEDVCRHRPFGAELKPDRIAADERLGHRVGGCGYTAPTRGVVNRKVIETAREAWRIADTFARQAGQSHADRTRVAKPGQVSQV